ncbi:ABC transporter permease [Microbacterium sp. NPDC058389]|uniref:ABC transporter permease n=1 Tax=Microbacterium sp. NPDC058389 TaxID=3346475 RepID=UPI003647C8AD
MLLLLRRLGFYAIALLIAIAVNFFVPRLAPGDPASALVAKLGTGADQASLESLRTAYGLTDDPLGVQFLQYLGNLATGDFGLSISRFPSPVTEVISGSLGWTVLLGSVSLIIAYLLGSTLGIIAAWYRGSWFDRTVPPVLIFIGSFPYFFLALLLVYVFAVGLGWFPIGQAYSTPPEWSWEFVGDVLWHMALPVTTVVLVTAGTWTLNMRNAMMSVTSEDYLALAEAKGLSVRAVVFRHGARNALLPSVTLLGGMIGAVVGGQVMVEIVFSYPGVGMILMNAVSAHDYPLIQTLFLIITVTVLAANFIVDIVYVLLDPRTREVTA